MRLVIDDKEFVTESVDDAKLINMGVLIAEDQWNKLPDAIRLGLKAAMRALLMKMELAHPDMRETFRPPKHTDVFYHLMHIAADFLLERSYNAGISIETNPHSRTAHIKPLQFPSESSGG